MTTITGAFAALNGIKALRQKRVGVRPLQKYMTNVEASPDVSPSARTHASIL
jgi:hypothetical protein